jgi:hypothetical protein
LYWDARFLMSWMPSNGRPLEETGEGEGEEEEEEEEVGILLLTLDKLVLQPSSPQPSHT